MAGDFLARLLAFVAVLYAARVIGPTEFGYFSLVYGAVTIGMIVTDMGLTPLVIRRVSRTRTVEVVWITMAFNGVVALVVYGGLVAGTAILAPDAAMVAVVLGAMLPCQALASSGEALLIAHERLPRVGQARGLGNLCLAAAVVVGLAWWPTAIGAAVGFAVGNLVKTALAWFFARRVVERGVGRGAGCGSMRDLLREAFPFAVAAVVSFLYFRADIFLLGLMTSPAEVGHYSGAYRIIEGAILIPGAAVYALFPGWTRSRDRVVREAGKVVASSAALGGGLALAIIATAGLYSEHVLGAGYEDSAAVLRILALGLPLLFADIVCGWVAYAIGRERLVIVNGLIALGVNLSLNVVLIPRFGGSGAAVATVVSEAVNFLGFVVAWLPAILRQSSRLRHRAWLRARALGTRVATVALVLGLITIAGMVVGHKPQLGLGLAIAMALAAVLVRSNARAYVLTVLPFAILVPVNYVVYSGAGPDMVVPRLAVIVGVLLVAVRMVLSRESIARPPTSVVVTFSIFATLVFTVAASDPTAASYQAGISMTLGALAPALLVLWAVRGAADLHRLAAALVAVGSIAAVLGLWEAATGRYLLPEVEGVIYRAGDRSGGTRIQSVFPHSIVLGISMALIIPITLALWSRRRGLLPLGALLVQILALLLTLSRGPWIGVVAAVAVMGMIDRRRMATLLMLGCIAAPVVAMSPLGGTVGGAAQSLVAPRTSAEVATLEYRRQLVDAGWSYTREHPFGTTIDPRVQRSLVRDVNGRGVNLADSVDNAYLKVGMSLGLVGLAAFVIFIGAILVSAFRAAVRLRERDPLPAALCGSLAAMVIVSATVATFSWEQMGVLFWLIVGMAMAYAGSAVRRADFWPARDVVTAGATRPVPVVERI